MGSGNAKHREEAPAGVRAVIDALYRDFLLRDLFAKVVPGSIVLVTAATGLGLLPMSLSVGWPAAILLAGGAWLAGFAVQSIGEALRLLRHYPPRYREDAERYGVRIQFKRCATPAEKRRVERYALIKEAAGNGGTALVLACAVSLIRASISGSFLRDADFLIFWLVSLILALALIRTNRTHLTKQYAYMEKVLGMQESEG